MSEESVSMEAANKKESIPGWGVISVFLNSGIMFINFTLFPFKVETEGEGMYSLIHFIVAIVIIRAILLSELLVGQLNQSGSVKVWGHMVPLMKGIGYISCLASILVLGSGSFLTSLGAFYWANSFTEPLPWSVYNGTNNSVVVTNNSVDAYYRNVAFPYVSNFSEAIGPPHWHLCLPMLVVWIGIYLLNFVCDQLLPSLVLILSLIPYLLIVALFLGSLWNGATPNFFELKWPSSWASIRPEIWITSVGQCLMYLPLGLGTVTRIASMRDLHDNISRIATYASLLGYITERIVSILLHTLLRDYSSRTGVPLRKLLKTGSATLLVTLPDYFSTLEHFPQALTITYFTLLVTICVGRILILFRGFKGSIEEIFPETPKILSSVISCIIGYISGLPFLSPHGKTITFVVSTFGINLMKTILVLLETIGIHIYGINNLSLDMKFMNHRSVSLLTKIIWRLAIIPIMVSVTVANIVHLLSQFFSYDPKNPPHWILDNNVLIAVVVVLTWIILGVCELLRFVNMLQFAPVCVTNLTVSHENWGPKEPNQKEEWRLFKGNVMNEDDVSNKNEQSL